jgi:hypothetical protein
MFSLRDWTSEAVAGSTSPIMAFVYRGAVRRLVPVSALACSAPETGRARRHARQYDVQDAVDVVRVDGFAEREDAAEHGRRHEIDGV